jgi:hypothetical protein
VNYSSSIGSSETVVFRRRFSCKSHSSGKPQEQRRSECPSSGRHRSSSLQGTASEGLDEASTNALRPGGIGVHVSEEPRLGVFTDGASTNAPRPGGVGVEASEGPHPRDFADEASTNALRTRGVGVQALEGA